MNVEEFYALLANPELLRRTDKAVLEQWIRQYPYFQTLYLLAARKSSLEHESVSESKLNMAAAYALDRVRLYELINGTENNLRLKKEKAESLPSGNENLDELLQSVHDKKSQVLSAFNLETKSSDVEDDAELLSMEELKPSGSEYVPPLNQFDEENATGFSDEQSSEIEMIRQMEQEFAEQGEYELTEEFLLLNELGGGGSEYFPADDFVPEEIEESFTEETDPEITSTTLLEEEFILHDIEADFREHEVTNISESESIKEVENEAPAGFELIPNLEMTTLNELDAAWTERQGHDQQEPEPPSLRIIEHVESPGEFLPEKSYTFLEWLSFFKSDTTKAERVKPANQPAQPVENEDTTEITEGGYINLGKQEDMEVIDKMISVFKQDEDVQSFPSPLDLARKSIEMDEEIVSETLAQVYENQGLIDKAIRQYVKLSLRFPEKSLFFAARIKELRTKK